ncbi:MAG: FliG C-terminal domain-containing protein [Elusimicrobiota bacterium]
MGSQRTACLSLILLLGISPVHSESPSGVDVPDLALLEQERQLREELEKKIQSDIIDPILGQGKAMVFVSVELDVITTKEKIAQKGTGSAGKAQTKSSLFDEAEFLMPGIPKPKSLSQVPAEGKTQSSEQEKGAEQVKVTQRTVVKRMEIVILHDDMISADSLGVVSQRIIDALSHFKVGPEQIVFKPTKFKPTTVENMRNPDVYIPIIFAMLLMMFLMFLFGPVSSFMRGYIRGLEKREGAEIEMNSETKGPEAGGPGSGMGGGAFGSLEGEIDKESEEKTQEEAMKLELFNFINDENVKRLVYLLKHEEPWIIAVVISYLKPDYAKLVMKDVLESLPLDRQAKVAIETATIRQLTLEQVLAIEKDMRDRVNFVIGGIEPLVKTLEDVSPQTAEGILEYLKNEKPEVYDKVRQRLVLFEDIVSMPDKAVAIALREVKAEDIAKALVNVSPEIEQKCLSNISSGAANIVKEEMQLLSNVPDDVISRERQKIVDTIKHLEEKGTITFRKRVTNQALEGIDEDEMRAKERQKQWRLRQGDQEEPAVITDKEEHNEASETADEWYAQGEQLYEQGRQEEALEAFSKAAETNPDFWQAYQYIGACHYSAGRYNDALRAYEQVLKLNPSDEVKQMVDAMRVQVGKA